MNGIPLAFAFSAGLLASVNPCGFAMLPAFVGTYLGVDDKDFEQRGPGRRAAEGFAVGLAVTSGFMVVFAAIGVVIALAGNVFARQFPIIVLVLGVGLVAFGAWLAGGRALKIGLPAPGRAPTSRGLRQAFVYGTVYGLASLGCTLPIFLVVVGSSFSAGSIGKGSVLFLAYGAGMGTVVTVVAIGVALFKGAMTRWLRMALPYVQQTSGALLIAAGAYLVLRELHQTRIGRAGWINALATHTSSVAAVLIGTATVVTLLIWWLTPLTDNEMQQPAITGGEPRRRQRAGRT